MVSVLVLANMYQYIAESISTSRLRCPVHPRIPPSIPASPPSAVPPVLACFSACLVGWLQIDDLQRPFGRISSALCVPWHETFGNQAHAGPACAALGTVGTSARCDCCGSDCVMRIAMRSENAMHCFAACRPSARRGLDAPWTCAKPTHRYL